VPPYFCSAKCLAARGTRAAWGSLSSCHKIVSTTFQAGASMGILVKLSQDCIDNLSSWSRGRFSSNDEPSKTSCPRLVQCEMCRDRRRAKLRLTRARPFTSKLRRVSKGLGLWLCWSSSGNTMFASKPTFKLASDGQEYKGMLIETRRSSVY